MVDNVLQGCLEQVAEVAGKGRVAGEGAGGKSLHPAIALHSAYSGLGEGREELVPLR